MKKIMLMLVCSTFFLTYFSPTITNAEAFDVIVVSGEPEGVSAAVSAARNGARVLLLEKREGLGGLITYGMLNFLDLPQNNTGEIVSQGIFKEWRQLAGGENVVTVDIDTAQEAFMTLVQNEKNITLQLNSQIVDVIKDGSTLKGVVVKGENGIQTYYAKAFIDSTPDGDLAALAGVPYFIGQNDIGKTDKMAVTLMIYLQNVDWDALKQAAHTGVLGGAGINETAAWGFGRVLHEYEEQAPGNRTTVRGLNIGRTPKGFVFINALQIFDVDGLDQQSIQEAIAIGKTEIDHFLPWLQKNLPGFEQATIVDFPKEVYVRETRHFESEYMLPVKALWENEHHWDDIAIGGYPADIQATAKTNFGTITVNPNQYGIPFRSLVPLHIDGLLIASKASGYTSLAAGSTRIIPTGMATAQAAGVASAISIQQNLSFREMSKQQAVINQIQATLKDQGAYLKQLKNPDFSYKGEHYYDALRTLYSYDLISGRYKNDFYVNETMTDLSFVKMMINGYSRMSPKFYQKNKESLTRLFQDSKNEPLTNESLQRIFTALNLGQAPTIATPWTRKEGYTVIADVLTKARESVSEALVK